MWLIPRMRQTHLDRPGRWSNAQEFVDPGRGRYPADVALLRGGWERVSLSRGLLSRPMPDYPFLVLVLEGMRYSHGIRGNHRESHSMGWMAYFGVAGVWHTLPRVSGVVPLLASAWMKHFFDGVSSRWPRTLFGIPRCMADFGRYLRRLHRKILMALPSLLSAMLRR